MKRIAFLLLAIMALASCNDKININITNPNVEQQVHPQALATAQPRFSWNYETSENEVVQQNYRIIVATSPENVQNSIGDLWDSGVVPSNQMLYIPYAGKELKSRDKAYWKVITTVTAEGKKAKVESEVKSFEISLLNQEDWQAKWIGHEFEDDVLVGHTRLAARYLRKDFALQGEVSEARLYVSGMGVYSAYLNGTEIAPEELLKPTLSWFSKRVYFNTYDVTAMLQQGDNAIGIILEGGRYTTIRYDVKNPNWDGTSEAYGASQYIEDWEAVYTVTCKGPVFTADGKPATFETKKYKVQLFNEGKSYFYKPIMHNNDLVDDDTDPVDGYYGIVRNHLYKVKATKIYGLGTPIPDPDQTIIPVKPVETESYIAAEIEILKYKVVENEYELN